MNKRLFAARKAMLKRENPEVADKFDSLTAEQYEALNEEVYAKVTAAGRRNASSVIAELISDPVDIYKYTNPIARTILKSKLLKPGETYYIPSVDNSRNNGFDHQNYVYYCGEDGSPVGRKVVGYEKTVIAYPAVTEQLYLNLSEVITRKYDILEWARGKISKALPTLEDYRLIQLLAASVGGSDPYTVTGGAGGFIRYLDVVNAIETVSKHDAVGSIIVSLKTAYQMLTWNYRESIKNSLALNIYNDKINVNGRANVKHGTVIGDVAGVPIVVVNNKIFVNNTSTAILADDVTYVVGANVGAFLQQELPDGSVEKTGEGEPFKDPKKPLPTYTFYAWEMFNEVILKKEAIVKITTSAS